MSASQEGERSARLGRGDQAVGELRRQLADAARQTTFRGRPASKLDPAAVSDLIDAYLELRREG